MSLTVSGLCDESQYVWGVQYKVFGCFQQSQTNVQRYEWSKAHTQKATTNRSWIKWTRPMADSKFHCMFPLNACLVVTTTWTQWKNIRVLWCI